MMAPSYLDQYKRMMRYFERFRRINEGKAHDEHSDNNRDDACSFFIHCYHLKDWIKNDPETGVSEEALINFVNDNESIKICHDICNGVKHLVLTRPKMGEGAEMQ